MKLYLDGTYTPQTSHNTPSYKSLYRHQLSTNKGLLIALGVTLFLGLGIIVGCSLRVTQYKTEIAVLHSQINTGLNVSVGYADYASKLETELASCSAKLKTSKLSKKAQLHMRQQPEVAQKIKQVFGDEWAEAIELFSRESSLIVDNINPSSGACGLVQSLPCTKLVNQCSLQDIDCQLAWGKKYISSRYGNPSKALEFHNAHNYY